MKKIVRLHIIDYSDAFGIEHCELPPNMTANSFTELMKMVCMTHEQPLSGESFRFLCLSSERWLENGDILADQPDSFPELVAISEAVIHNLGNDSSVYSTILELRKSSEEIHKKQILENRIRKLVDAGESLKSALQSTEEIFILQPNISGLGVRLRPLFDRIKAFFQK